MPAFNYEALVDQYLAQREIMAMEVFEQPEYLRELMPARWEFESVEAHENGTLFIVL